MSLPYARQEEDDASPSGWVKVCPECGERIPVFERKDFESFTGSEYAEHYDKEHRKAAAGGLDGILVTFGEGTDADTFNATFPYESIRLTLADGMTMDVENHHFGWDDEHGTLVLRYRTWDDHAGEGIGDIKTVPADQIVGVHIH